VNVGLKPRPASLNREVLAGLIERVTFHNAANGFCNLRVIGTAIEIDCHIDDSGSDGSVSDL
jgi:hypothetical protein